MKELVIISFIFNSMTLFAIAFIKRKDVERLYKIIPIYKKLEEKDKKKIELDYSNVIENVYYAIFITVVMSIIDVFVEISNVEGFLSISLWGIVFYSSVMFLGTFVSCLEFVTAINDKKKYLKAIIYRLDKNLKMETEIFEKIKITIDIYGEEILSKDFCSETIKYFLMIKFKEKEDKLDEKSNQILEKQEDLIKTQISDIINYQNSRSKEKKKISKENKIEKIFNY